MQDGAILAACKGLVEVLMFLFIRIAWGRQENDWRFGRDEGYYWAVTRATNHLEGERKRGCGKGLGAEEVFFCMIKGSANCVTDRQRRIALDGVTCILISFESQREWRGSGEVMVCGFRSGALF